MSQPQSPGHAKPQSHQATPRTFVLSTETSTHTIEYTEHRGPGAPPAALGALGDIYLDTKAPALFARCDSGWMIWPGPHARGAALAHPTHPDHFLWASIQGSRVLWLPKPKMKKLIASATEILTQIIASEGRRDSKNLKRKAGEAPLGAGDAKSKKPRVSDPAPPETECGAHEPTPVVESHAPPVESSKTKPPAPSSGSLSAKPVKAPVKQNPPSAKPSTNIVLLLNPVLSRVEPPKSTVKRPAFGLPATVPPLNKLDQSGLSTAKPPPSNVQGTAPSTVESRAPPAESKETKPPASPSTKPIKAPVKQNPSSANVALPIKPVPPRVEPPKSTVKSGPPKVVPPSDKSGLSTAKPPPSKAQATAASSVESRAPPVEPRKTKPPAPSSGPPSAKPVKAPVKQNPSSANVALPVKPVSPRVETPKSTVKPATSAPEAVPPMDKSGLSTAKPPPSDAQATPPRPEAHSKPSTSSVAPVASVTPPLKRAAANALNSDGSRKRQRMQPPTLPAEPSPSVQEDATAKAMEPVEKELNKLKSGTVKTADDGRRSLVILGRHIEQVLKEKEDGREQWRHRLWAYAALFWPKKHEGATLEDEYKKLVARDQSGSVSTPVVSIPGADTPSHSSPAPTSNPPLQSKVVQDSGTASVPAPATKPFDDLLTLMRNNTKILKSTPAKAPQASSSLLPPSMAEGPHPRSTVQDARSLAASSAVSQRPASTDQRRHVTATEPRRPAETEIQEPRGRPIEARSHRDSTASAMRADSHPVPSPASSVSEGLALHSRCSRSGSAAPSTTPARPVEERIPAPVVIASLQRQYTKYHSEAVSERQTNSRWLAESAAAAALVKALTTANDTLKRENDSITVENVRLRGIVGPDNIEVEPGQRQDEQVELRPAEEQAELEQEQQVKRRQEEEEQAELEQEQQTKRRLEEEEEEEQTKLSQQLKERVAEAAELSQQQQVGQPDIMLEDHIEPRRGKGQEEQCMIQEDAHQNASALDIIAIKQEPADVPSGIAHQHPEIIDLTLDDSDDEDVGKHISSFVVSSAPKPTAAVNTSSPLAEKIARRDGDGIRIDDAPMEVDSADAGTGSPTNLQFQPSIGSNLGTASTAVAEPPSAHASSLVKPSVPGHFCIVDTDFDYTDERLWNMVLQYRKNDATPNAWGAILAHLQLIARASTTAAAVSAPEGVSVDRWAETVEALRGYYKRYVEPTFSKNGPTSVPPVPLNNSKPKSPSPARDIVIVDAPMLVTAVTPPEQEHYLTADMSETPSMRVPSSPSEAIGINRQITPDLEDAKACKNTLLVLQVKVEDGNFDTLDGQFPPCARRLNQTHLDELFPVYENEPTLLCTVCISLNSDVKYECPVETPLEELSAHVEKHHAELFEAILKNTEGMSHEEILEWFSKWD